MALAGFASKASCHQPLALVGNEWDHFWYHLGQSPGHALWCWTQKHWYNHCEAHFNRFWGVLLPFENKNPGQFRRNQSGSMVFRWKRGTRRVRQFMFLLADGKPYVRFSTFLGFWVLGFGFWVGGGFGGGWDNNKPIACYAAWSSLALETCTWCYAAWSSLALETCTWCYAAWSFLAFETCTWCYAAWSSLALETCTWCYAAWSSLAFETCTWCYAAWSSLALETCTWCYAAWSFLAFETCTWCYAAWSSLALETCTWCYAAWSSLAFETCTWCYAAWSFLAFETCTWCYAAWSSLALETWGFGGHHPRKVIGNLRFFLQTLIEAVISDSMWIPKKTSVVIITLRFKTRLM